MTRYLLELCDSDLQALASALRAGRLQEPLNAVALQRLIPKSMISSVAADLSALYSTGFDAAKVAFLIDVLLSDRRSRLGIDDLVDFVTTGPEAGGVTNRDTSVVVRELFASAKKRVLVAGYAVYQGQKVFQALADRMHENPDLQVRLFLDIQRPQNDQTAPKTLVEKFRYRFSHYQWPENRPLPKLFYFPQSLELAVDKKASLHAKCVVVDDDAVFLSSANFTEAAQQRNIEMGLLLKSSQLASKITKHFDSLVADKLLQPLL